MTGFHFATCNRNLALQFLKAIYSDSDIHDSPESAGRLLDLVEADIVRIQDPNFHHPANVIPGSHWREDPGARDEAASICAEFHQRALESKHG